MSATMTTSGTMFVSAMVLATCYRRCFSAKLISDEKVDNTDQRTQNISANKLTPPSCTVLQGISALEFLLAQSRNDSSPLNSSDTFFDWVINTIQSKSSYSNEFSKKQSIVEILYSHEDEIKFAETREADALAVWEAHPKNSERSILSKQSVLISKALEQMKVQCDKDQTPEKLKKLQELIRIKSKLLENVNSQLHQLNSIPQYESYVTAKKAHEVLLLKLGVTKAVEELGKLERDIGIRKSKGGFSFEDEAAKIIHNKLLTKIAIQHEVAVESLIVVRNITFKMASTECSPGEIDMLVCMKHGHRREEVMSADDGIHCKRLNRKTRGDIVRSYSDVVVLAVIEVKKNGNDIGKSFLSYQSTLNWLCGNEDNYNAEEWKCKQYPKGHFIKPFVYKENDSAVDHLVFSRKSFQYIRSNQMMLNFEELALSRLDMVKDSGVLSEQLYFCKDLYYVTKASCLENICSKDMQILLHRLAGHVNIFKQRQLLQKADVGKSTNATAKLRLYIEELRCSSILSSKFRNTFCTADLVRTFIEYGLHDQLYCVENSKHGEK